MVNYKVAHNQIAVVAVNYPRATWVTLPALQLVQAIHAPNACELMIAVRVDTIEKFTVEVCFGDFEKAIVGLEFFKDDGSPKSRTRPDFTKPKLMDGGLSLKFGDYKWEADLLACYRSRGA